MTHKLRTLQTTVLITMTLVLLLGFFQLQHTVQAAKVPDSRPITNESYANKESLQPYGTVLQVDELKHWSPDKDPDAKYNRSFVPLKERHMGPLVNSNASEDARVLSLAMTNPRASESKSQGGKGADVYAFTHFQYVDTYNFWGGSAHEGIIAIPNPEHIDSAHKNGVKVTATIFFPWGDSEFVEEAMEQFTEQDEDGNFIIADKLFEISEYYGFEGFFINQESDVSQALADKLKEMLVYIQENKPDDFVMQWYDSMTPDGKINYQNSINENNIGMIQDGSDKINDDIFLNFDWNKSRIDKAIETMEDAGRDPYDIHATWEYFPYSKDPGRVEDIIDEDGITRTSIGLLSATTTLTNSDGVDDFQNNEDPKFWIGPSGDPTDDSRVTDEARDTEEFPGISSLVADKTPVLGTNFVTHFSSGNGHNFYENGKVTSDEAWHNRSLTDVMPTWRWIVESDGAKLTPKVDYEDAYFAGSSLNISGDLEADNPNHIKLYSSKLDVSDQSKVSLTYKSISDESHMKVGLNFGDTYDEKNFTFFDVEDGSAGVWNTVEIDLSEHAGEEISAISLQFAGNESAEEIDVNVGRLAITDSSTTPDSVDKLDFDEIMFADYANAEARIDWKHAENAELYMVDRVNDDGAKEFIGATYNNAFYTDMFQKEGEEASFNFEVTPISETGEKGEATELAFEWTIPDGTAELEDQTERENFALGQPAVSNVTVEGDGPVSNINDGIIPLSKWATQGGASEDAPHTATIDLGEEKDISRWVVHHANAPGAREDKDMNTIDFKLRYAGDDGEALLDGDTDESKARVDEMEFTDADRVEDNTLDITDRNLEEPIKARYVQLYVTNSDRSPWKATRIYEFEVYEEQHDARTNPINMQFVKAENKEGANDTVTVSNVTEGDTVSLYKDLDTEEVLAEKTASEDGIVEFTGLDFGKDAGRIYYSVKNPDLLESVRRSVAYNAEDGEGLVIPKDENIQLLQSLKGSPSGYGKERGILTISDVAEGVQVEVYEQEADVFPILLSAPSRDGVITQERIPLEDEGGEVYIRLIKEREKSSEKFPVSYDGDIQVDTSSLEVVYDKYSNLQEENYVSASWSSFAEVMADTKGIIEQGTDSVDEIVSSREDVIDRANQLELKGNTSELAALIEENEDKEEPWYEADTWEDFESAFDKAYTIIEEDDSGQVEIDEVTETLAKAVDNLVKAEVDTVTLEMDETTLVIGEEPGQLNLTAELDNRETVDLDIEDVDVLIEEANILSIENDGSVHPEKVGETDVSVEVEGTSSDSITIKVEIDVSELEALLDEAEEINNDDNTYTEESFEQLEKVIQEVEERIADIQTMDELEEVIDELQKAINELETVEGIDVSKLVEQLEEAKKQLAEDKYTEASREQLEKEIKEIEASLEDIEDEGGLQSSMDALEEAVAQLVIDLSDLQDLIEKAKTLEADRYTAVSFSKLQETIEEVEGNIDSIETEEALNEAMSDLQSAIDQLEEKESIDITELEDLLDEAIRLLSEADHYTEASLADLAKTIGETKEDIDTIETKDELANALDELQLAIDVLELDKTTLLQLVEEALSISNAKGQYTKNSYDNLRTVAEELQSNLDAIETQEELEEAIEKLENALGNLTEVEEDDEGKPGKGDGSSNNNSSNGEGNNGSSNNTGENNGSSGSENGENTGNTGTSTDENANDDNKLPATATTIFTWMALGLFVLGLGFIIFIISRRFAR